MARLFEPITFRDLTLRNRVVMSPMCQYCAASDGKVTEWHYVHYATRAVGGVGLLMVEATAVESRGRISTEDLGLWEDDQVPGMARIVEFAHGQGVPVGLQLAHAGRKAWNKQKSAGPILPVGPSAVPYASDHVVPAALDRAGIEGIIDGFVASTRRAVAAGFDLLELHAAHGYLLHQFISPLSNFRTDEYGGSLQNRARLLFEVVEAVRAAWPASKPLFVRISGTDYVPGGLDLGDWLEVVPRLISLGVDLVDCTSGGLVPVSHANIPVAIHAGPGYQVPYAARLKEALRCRTGAVGLITTPEYAEAILRTEQADLIFLGRELLRNPYWPLQAARELGVDTPWPTPYARAKK